ncbi:MAG: 2Fe-2S iron-sulfur cluster-binding protein [Phycisphaerales bacterium]
MSERITFTIDGRAIETAPGTSILRAADANGVYIPRLCDKEGLVPVGACRVCTVKVNGRPVAACTQPAADGMVVENDTEELRSWRRQLVEMLFVEGNHFCMFCEKSGACELQALAYRLGIAAPRYEYLWPKREVDASHADILLDRNRCILCGRCERASRDLDGKSVFGFVGRGIHKRLAVNATARLVDTNADARDQAISACPVGAILRKHGAYGTPVGQRPFDERPIGSSVEHPATLTIEGGAPQ